MPVNGIKVREWQQSGSQIVTSDFNMVPGEMMVTAALTGTTGGGTPVRRNCQSIIGPGRRGIVRTVVAVALGTGRKGLRTLTVGIATGQDQTAQAVFSIFIF
jgi:hypothetical protein